MVAARENAFSWSVTRDRTFRECLRKYYFSYYGSWGGWMPGAPARTREIYTLRKLKNRNLWAGEVVHQCIATSLKNLSSGIQVLPLERILGITRDRMRTDFRDSRAGRYRENPAGYCGLFEHEYKLEVSREEWRATAERVDRCLKNFYESEIFASLRTKWRDGIVEVEELSQFELDGTPVTIRLDLACAEDDQIAVWDWKTGPVSDRGSLQLACYAAYTAGKYGYEPSQIIGRQFNLLEPSLHEQRFSKKSLEEIFSYIRGSMADMKSLLADPRANRAEENDFPKAEKTTICSRCNYLKVCRPSLNRSDL